MIYHVWTPGDELPDGIPEGCERWGLNLCQWMPEVDSPSDWGHHQPRRWPAEAHGYLEDDEITDDMLCGRRIPCEVRDSTSDRWVPQILVLVDTGDLRFVTKNGEPWRDCRIKKSDLPEAK